MLSFYFNPETQGREPKYIFNKTTTYNLKTKNIRIKILVDKIKSQLTQEKYFGTCLKILLEYTRKQVGSIVCQKRRDTANEDHR